MGKRQFIEEYRDRLTVVVRLQAILTKDQESGQYASSCPALKVYSQGRNVTEAKANIIEAVHSFIGGCVKHEILSKELKRLGFKKIELINGAQRRAHSGHNRKTKSVQSGNNGEKIIEFPVELPLAA